MRTMLSALAALLLVAAAATAKKPRMKRRGGLRHENREAACLVKSHHGRFQGAIPDRFRGEPTAELEEDHERDRPVQDDGGRAESRDCVLWRHGDIA